MTTEPTRVPVGKVACSCGRIVGNLWRVASAEPADVQRVHQGMTEEGQGERAPGEELKGRMYR